jgi:tyrosine-protein phosphatase SIW14
MRRIRPGLFSLLILAILIAGPIWYWKQRDAHLRNFRVVEDKVLYRSGQLSLKGLKRVIHDHGIKTVITLRDAAQPGERPPDWKEEEFCRMQELNYVRLPPREWSAEDDAVPADQSVRKFRAIMSDPANHPVLVHCYRGVHRSGAFSAIFRMEHQRWNNAQAIAEMIDHGYYTISGDKDLRGYLEKYQPTWKAQIQK